MTSRPVSFSQIIFPVGLPGPSSPFLALRAQYTFRVFSEQSSSKTYSRSSNPGREASSCLARPFLLTSLVSRAAGIRTRSHMNPNHACYRYTTARKTTPLSHADFFGNHACYRAYRYLAQPVKLHHFPMQTFSGIMHVTVHIVILHSPWYRPAV